MLNNDELRSRFNEGLHKHQEGHFSDAQKLYKCLVCILPANASFLGLLGTLMTQTQHHQRAVHYLNWALHLDPFHAASRSNLGNAFKALGQSQESIKQHKKALIIHPSFEEGLRNLGITLSQGVTQLEASLHYLLLALKLCPSQPETLSSIGNTLKDMARFDEAIFFYDQAIANNLGYAEALTNKGATLHKMERFDAALTCHTRAVECKPDLAESYMNRGLALQKLKRTEEVLKNHTRSFRLNQSIAEAHLNFANGLSGLGLQEDALKHYRYAMALKPTLDQAYLESGSILTEQRCYEKALLRLAIAINLIPDHAEPRMVYGYTFLALGQHEEAITNIRRSLIFKPNLASTFIHLGCCLLEMRRFNEAAGFFQRAYICDDKHVDVASVVLYCAAKLFDWEKVGYWLQFSKDALQNLKSIGSPFPLLCVTDDSDLHQKASNTFSKSQGFTREHHVASARNSLSTKIKVGYFTSDLREHPVFKNLVPLLKGHDRSKFEIVAFNLFPGTDPSAPALFDRFFDISSISDKAASELARSQKLDIAVDLNGHTEFSRTMLFAYGVAPIQINFLGYPGTMGGNAHDFIITDKFVVPPELEPHYSESVAHLPQFFMPYDFSVGARLQTPIKSRSDYGLPKGRFVFCSFNEFHKITSATFDSWVNILRTVKDAVLWIAPRGGISESQLIDAFISSGIESSRIILAERVADHFEHLSRLRFADLMLDTFPYNSHTTACDAISVGLPILTIAGKSFASRVSGSLLTCIGVQDLIVDSHASYESMAILLAHDSHRYGKIRQRVREGIGRLPSNIEYARNLESLYKTWTYR